MNINEVEQRLEALAGGGARPDVPEVLYDRLAALSAGAPTQGLTKVDTSRATGRIVPFGRGRTSRTRTLTGLGLAAAFILAGSLVFAAGSHYLQSNVPPTVQPTAPVSLGDWIHRSTLPSAYAQDQIVSLSWQNNEIVGLASGADANGFKNTCVLISKDGSSWSCNPLPRPAGLCSDPDYCIDPGAVAVNNGRWIAIGEFNPNASNKPLVTDPSTVPPLLTWTSDDGVTWTEQTQARLSVTYQAGFNFDLLPTSTGFVMSGYEAAPANGTGPSLLTTTDGTSWQSATISGGSLGTGIINVAGDPATGYVAFGLGQSSSAGTLAAAHSADGVSWTFVDPLAGVSRQLAARVEPGAYIRYDKSSHHWVVVMLTNDTTVLSDSGLYQDASADGVHWQLTRISDVALELGMPAISVNAASGWWAMENIHMPPQILVGSPSPYVSQVPGWTPTTYWSADGRNWVSVGPAPVGEPLGIVETPTELIAITMIYPNADDTGTPTVSVWAATKK